MYYEVDPKMQLYLQNNSGFDAIGDSTKMLTQQNIKFLRMRVYLKYITA